MSDLTKNLQKTEYAILKELDRICKEHNIEYLLGQGTLLGAAKYKGFIPWDDDVDLLIYHKQLKKLHEVFPKYADKKYLLTSYKVERYFPLSWSKIRNSETLSRPVRYKNIPINWGICIDLFPVYPLSGNKVFRKLEILNYRVANKFLMAEFTKYEPDHGKLTRLLEKVPLCIRHLYINFATGILKMHSDKSEYVLVTCKKPVIIKRDILFGEKKTLSFENEELPAPSKYHEYLTMTYGDYMAPLPEHLQKGHDLFMGEIEWKL